jgi:hypothetical protein
MKSALIAKGVLKTMVYVQLRLAAAAVVGVAVVGGAGAAAVRQLSVGQKPETAVHAPYVK